MIHGMIEGTYHRPRVPRGRREVATTEWRRRWQWHVILRHLPFGFLSFFRLSSVLSVVHNVSSDLLI